MNFIFDLFAITLWPGEGGGDSVNFTVTGQSNSDAVLSPGVIPIWSSCIIINLSIYVCV